MKKLALTKPRVADVEGWDLCFDEVREHDWRGRPDGTCQVYSATNYFDYFKIVTTSDKITKTKYFFGETAWMEAQQYVWDFGCYIQF